MVCLIRISQLLLAVLLLERAYTAPTCPFLCACTGRNAECSGIASLTGFPLPEAVVNITFLGVALPAIEAGKFHNGTESIEFRGSNIGQIHRHAFSNLKQLRTLSIKSSKIETIHSGAFQEMNGKLDVYIWTSTVDKINQGAFNASSISTLDISLSNVELIHTRAFKQINAKTFNFSDSSFGTIQPSAFDEINVDTFDIKGCHVRNMSAKAFVDVHCSHIATTHDSRHLYKNIEPCASFPHPSTTSSPSAAASTLLPPSSDLDCFLSSSIQSISISLGLLAFLAYY